MFGEEHPFVWEVPDDGQGYDWVDDEAPSWNTWERPYRVLARRYGVAFHDYQPLDGSVALYKELECADLTEAGFLAFANQYGRLGLDSVTVHVQGGVRVEPFSDWRHEAAWLREALCIWSLVESGDHAGLAEVIRWEGRCVRYERSDACRRDLGSPSKEEWEEIVRQHPHLTGAGRDFKDPHTDPLGLALGGESLTASIQPGDLVRPAVAVVLNLVNGSVSRYCGPAFYWSTKRRKVEMQVSPDSLLGAIWWQFGQAVRTGKKTRACRECGRFFETSGGASRPDREVCSNACRSRSYRMRQEQARAQHAAGRSFKEIATELGSDVKTVKGWITGKKKGK